MIEPLQLLRGLIILAVVYLGVRWFMRGPDVAPAEAEAQSHGPDRPGAAPPRPGRVPERRAEGPHR